MRTGAAREVVDEHLTASSEAQKTVMDLSDANRHGDQGRQLRLSKMEWLSGLPLQHGEPFTMRVHFQTSDEVHDVSTGLGFSNLEGVRLLSYDTDFQDGHRPNISKGCQGHADITVAELPLAPGLYSFSLGCRSGDAFGLDYIQEAGQVEVIMGPKTPGYIAVPGAGVRLTSEWTWHLNSSPSEKSKTH